MGRRPGTPARSRPRRSALLCVRRPEHDRVVLALVGELDVASVADVDMHLRELRAAGFHHVVLELRHLKFMGSVGIGLLVRWAEQATEEGWHLDVVGDRDAVERVVDLTGVRALL